MAPRSPHLNRLGFVARESEGSPVRRKRTKNLDLRRGISNGA